MKVGIFAVLMVFVLIFGGCAIFDNGEGQADAAINVEATVIAVMEAQILASTVQIALFDHGWIEGDLKHTHMAIGLGTVVEYGGQPYILTHNHWSIAAAELNRAEIRNGSGELLQMLPGNTFYNLVRYADGGTMVLNAPEELGDFPAAELGDGTAVQMGNTVWMATYANETRNSIAIETAWVQEIDASYIPGRFKLQGEEKAVVVGDSGGGVWVNGRLVGNLWGIYMVHTDYVGSELLDLLDNKQPTGSIIAGMQPLTGISGVIPEDMREDISPEGDNERGVQK